MAALVDAVPKTAEELAVEEAMYHLCATATDITQINLPPTDEFVVNSRGQKLHVRTVWPSSSVVRGVVVFCHGYGGHCSRPWVPYYTAQLAAQGYAFVGLDWHGFGYSDKIDGKRALIGTVDDLVDDLVSLLSALYLPAPHGGNLRRTALAPAAASSSPAGGAAGGGDGGLSAGPAPPPFYIQGFSLGGPVVVLAAHRVHTALPAVATYHKGIILVAPMLAINRPPRAVESFLNRVVVPFFGASPIPPPLSSAPAHNLSWKSEGFIRYYLLDGSDPRGLGYPGAMRFQTASTALKLSARALSVAPECRFPVLILHDPDDKITLFKGTRAYFDTCGTPAAAKTLVEMTDGRHDLLCNELTTVTKLVLNWLQAQTPAGAR